MISRVLGFACGLALVLGSATALRAGPFTAGNLAIYRVGDGSATLTGSATAVFIDEYTISGTPVQSIALPTVDAGGNQMLTASGNDVSEGYLSRSFDRRFLLLAGYDAAVGTTNVAMTSSAMINRIIGRIDDAGTIDTTTALATAFSGSNIRSATSTDGIDVWAAGNSSPTGTGGVWHATVGVGGTTQVSSTVNDVRVVQVVGKQLFVSSGAAPFRLATVGDGTPTDAGNTTTNLPGITTSQLTSPHSYFFTDLDDVISFGFTGLDTAYVADDNLNVVKKFTFNGTDWIEDGSIALTNVRGLTGIANGANVTLYATNGTSLQKLTDTSGYDGTMNGSFTTIASAASNTAFRGIDFAPAVPEPGAVALGGVVLLIGGVGLVTRRRR